MDNAIQVRNVFVPWDYGLISAQIPEDGELVCVKNAPNFTGQNRTVMGDGIHDVAWLIAQLVVTPSDLQQEILAEQAARIAADAAHAALTSAHGATATPAASRIAMYDAAGRLKSGAAPAAATDVVRKTELDGEAQARATAVSNEAQARQAADASEAAIRLGQFNDLSANKQDKKPDGTNSLIGTDGKLNPVYMSGSVLSGMIYGGTFNGSGFISASSYAPALQGVKIDTVNTANYPGFFFIAQNPYIFGGNSYDPGDWAISLGAHNPAWAKIDNASAVSSVNGKTGAVILTKGDVGLGNVDNTRDLDKPVSSAQWEAISAEAAARASADAAEEAARKTAVAAEEDARKVADMTLQSNIDLEAARRVTADSEIQEQIDDINGELNEIPAIYAPIESPHFTGVPTTPVPSYTIPEQVADVRGIIDLRNILIATLLRDTRVTWGEYTLMPRLRITRHRDRVRGVYYNTP
jgi:hypothetical protein